MSTFDLISLISSIASLILAIVAIALSIVFYKMSNTASEKVGESAKDINSSVSRLEKLFDKLYSDTFSMMKETVTDMRKHIWPEKDLVKNDEIEKMLKEKMNEIKESVNSDVVRILQRQKLSEKDQAVFKLEIQKLVDKVISDSRKAEKEARVSTLRIKLIDRINLLLLESDTTTAGKIVEALESEYSLTSMITELRKMVEEGLITASDKRISSSQVQISMKRK